MSPATFAVRSIKYELETDHEIQTPIIGWASRDEHGELTQRGRLRIHAGFECDGPSGPTVDDEHNMLPATEHDWFYKAMRERRLPLSQRGAVDRFFYERLRQCGMGWFRARYYYVAVRLFARSSAKPQRPEIVTVP